MRLQARWCSKDAFIQCKTATSFYNEYSERNGNLQLQIEIFINAFSIAQTISL